MVPLADDEPEWIGADGRAIERVDARKTAGLLVIEFDDSKAFCCSWDVKSTNRFCWKTAMAHGDDRPIAGLEDPGYFVEDLEGAP